MKLLFTIRTADRSPKKNYLGQTVASLVSGGLKPSEIHLVPTDPDIRWMDGHAANGCTIHLPAKHRTPNQNGLAQVGLLHQHPADWIVMTEDDLEWCNDPLGSIERWLDRYAEPHRLFYRFFSFGQLRSLDWHSAETPLKEQRGSQVVAMRSDDALAFAHWAKQHPIDWRPFGAPFQNRPHDGFDKLLGYWALSAKPQVTTGLVSRPFFVRHLGVESSIHSHGMRMDQHFGGKDWSYCSEVTV